MKEEKNLATKFIEHGMAMSISLKKIKTCSHMELF